MEIKVEVGDISQHPAKAIVVNLFEGVKRPRGATSAVDKALGGAISQLIKEGEIKGKLNELTLIHTLGRLPSPRVLVVGLGRQDAFKLDKARDLTATALRHLRRVGASTVATVVHGAGVGGLDPQQCSQAIAEGAVMGLYRFTSHKKKNEDEREIDALSLVEFDRTKAPALRRGVATGRVLAEAANRARDMANEPANCLTPAIMAEHAQTAAQDAGLECEVLEREQMQELGMGALLGVAQGSTQPPKLIVLRYRGAPRRKATLGLLGKGITFDSGGISIKPSAGMQAMKGDMSGGAAVISAMWAIGRLKPRINVTALVPATENMPSGSATKPGDVHRTMSGKTIEVVNTDAEGRLILADALAYADRFAPKAVVDLATLTGACVVALGRGVAAGAFSTLILTAVRGRLTRQNFNQALTDTIRSTCSLFVIVIGSMIFARFMAVSRIPAELSEYIIGSGLPPLGVFIGVCMLFVFLGCFLEPIGMMLLTLPIIFPALVTLGYDPIWFGILIIKFTEIGMITPPVGLNVYILKGVAPNVKIEDIFRGIAPFLLMDIITLALLFAFPVLSLWLPGTMN